jgi:tripartite motif-containing protein 2/3
LRRVVVLQLGQAHDAVSDELRRLDEATDACLEQGNRTFQEIASLVEQRRSALANAVKSTRDAKRRVLEEQLALIEAEKNKVNVLDDYLSPLFPLEQWLL